MVMIGPVPVTVTAPVPKALKVRFLAVSMKPAYGLGDPQMQIPSPLATTPLSIADWISVKSHCPSSHTAQSVPNACARGGLSPSHIPAPSTTTHAHTLHRSRLIPSPPTCSCLWCEPAQGRPLPAGRYRLGAVYASVSALSGAVAQGCMALPSHCRCRRR